MTTSFPDLERRFFREGVSWAEKEEILDAALRLRGGQGTSALERFIDAARVILCRADLVDPPRVGYGDELPLALRVPIASMILQRMPLTQEWLFSWWVCAGGKRKSCGSPYDAEFQTLFALRFAKRFPQGLPLSGPMPRLAPVYRAASGVFETPVDLTPYGGPLFDASSLREPLRIADEIAREATLDLEPLGALLSRFPERRGTVEAHTLLPAELRPYFPSRAAEDFVLWARTRSAAGRGAPLDELINLLRGGPAGPMSRAEFVDLAEVLARLGFGIAPDPRLSPRLPAPREPVVLFALGEEVSKPPSHALRTAIERLTLAASLARVSGTTSGERGLHVIAEEMRAGLPARERDLLDATRDWLSLVEPDIGPVRTLLQDEGPKAEEEVRELIATILGTGAAAEEVARKLGLPPMALSVEEADAPPMGQELPLREEYEAIPEGAPEPVPPNKVGTVPRAGEDAERGTAVEKKPTEVSAPSSPGRAGGFWLDPVKWEEKQRETEEAQKALSGALGETASPGPALAAAPLASPLVPASGPPPDPPPTAASGRFRGLDASAARLAAELIQWNRWDELEFEALARRHRVMPDGIVEILNEWSIERFHEPIVEVYEGYVLSPSVVEKLNTGT